jgi:hypothetical protein
MARYIGVDPAIANLLPTVALVAGFAAIWLLRARPGLAYSIGVLTMLFGSPVVNINWFTVLLAALAPAVWPLSGDLPTDGAERAGMPAGTSAGSAGATAGA